MDDKLVIWEIGQKMSDMLYGNITLFALAVDYLSPVG